MIEREEETYSLTLRSVRRQTIDALYERKALTGKPVCRLADEIITAYFENDPSTLEMRLEEVRPRNSAPRMTRPLTHRDATVLTPDLEA